MPHSSGNGLERGIGGKAVCDSASMELLPAATAAERLALPGAGSLGWRWGWDLLDGHRYFAPNALSVLPVPS